MRTTFAARAVLLLAAIPLAAHAFDTGGDDPGPAPVVRRTEGQSALAPMPASATPTAVMGGEASSPAAAVPAGEALSPLPTEDELRIEAYRKREAARPPPLKPVARPQQVQSLGNGRFLILPEKPLASGGTVSGAMFSDDTLLAVSETRPIAPTALAPVSATLAASSTAPSPSVARLPPLPKPPPPLVVYYSADNTHTGAAGAKAIAAWAAKLDSRMVYVMKVTGHTVTPPIGLSAARLTEARWNAVANLLQDKGVNLAPPSLQSLKVKGGGGKGRKAAKGSGQSLVVEVGKQVPIPQ
jgi:hypothetical protein